MMRRLLLLVCVLALAGCGGTGKRLLGIFKKEKNPDPPAVLVRSVPELRGRILWKVNVGRGYRKAPDSLRPVVAEDTVYVAERGGRVAALDLRSGKRRWSIRLKLPLTAGPGYADGKLIVAGGDAEVVALNAADGHQLWKSRLSGEILAPPAAGRGVVAVDSNDGSLTGLDLESGAVKWIYQHATPALTLRGAGAPVVAGDVVIEGQQGMLVALRLDTGDVVWEATVSTASGRSEIERLVDVDGDPLVIEGVVYAAGFQGGMSAIDAERGEVLWHRDEISSNHSLGGSRGLLFAVDPSSHVWGLQQRNGAVIWRQEQLHQRRLTAPVPVGDYLAVGDFEGWVHLLAQDDGRQIGRIEIDDSPIRVTPVVADDILLVYCESGKLAAIRVE